MDERIVEVIASEIRSLGTKDRAKMLAVAVDHAQDLGLDWRHTLLLVQEIERTLGTDLVSQNFAK